MATLVGPLPPDATRSVSCSPSAFDREQRHLVAPGVHDEHLAPVVAQRDRVLRREVGLPGPAAARGCSAPTGTASRPPNA